MNLLELIQSRRIALTPEYDAGWCAEVYDDCETAQYTGHGLTIDEAITDALGPEIVDRAMGGRKVIKDQTIDEALIEIMRTKKALEALRKFRKTCDRRCPNNSCKAAWKPVPFAMGDECVHCDTRLTLCMNPVVEHSAAKRASLDLTRKLADLRAGR